MDVQKIRRHIILVLILCAAIVPLGLLAENGWANPFKDVQKTDYYYKAVTELHKSGILDDEEYFYGAEPDSRGNLIEMLYRLHTSFAEKFDGTPAAFQDVSKYSPFYESVSWAVENGITSGVTETKFAPSAEVTREQLCAFVIRYAKTFDVPLEALYDAELFEDAADISLYARSPVMACRIAGLIHGYEDGCFYPKNAVSRAESASIIYSLLVNRSAQLTDHAKRVELAPDAYDALYADVQTMP